YAKVFKYQTQQRKPLTRKQQREFYTLVLRNQAGWKAKHFKGMTLEEIKENFDLIGAGNVKKLKTSEDVKETEEVHEDKVKEIMQLVPVKEVYVEALQVKHPIIDWKVHTEGQRSYWKITRLGVDWKLYDTCGVHYVTSKDKEIFMLVEKDYPLRKGLAIVMICYKLQVENYSQMANDLILKIYKIANYPIMEFPLSEKAPTASEESSHCQKKRDATTKKIALLLKSSSNCQSKSYDSYAKLVPHV
nr:hypothetical protein [Tanacetum cinerariifolium]